MSNEREMISLIQKYQKEVDNGFYLLKKYLHYNPKHREWWKNGLAPEGNFGPSYKYHYAFHGTWCKLNVEHISVDLDYQYFNERASFDAVRLANFARQIEGYETLTEFKQVEALLYSLLGKGLIKRRFPDQYCLPVDASIDRSIIK